MLLPSTRRVTGIAVTLAAACLTVACGARSEIDFPLPGAGARDAGRDAGRDAFIPPVDGGRDVFVPPVDAGRDVFVPPVDAGRDALIPPRDAAAGEVFLLIPSAPGPAESTWSWDGSTWDPVAVANRPSQRDQTALASDGRELVLFGGLDPNNDYLADTWLWNGQSWTEASPANAPSARGSYSLAQLGSTVVLFGGETGHLNLKTLGDTWVWDGTTWTELHPATSPPPRSLASFATLQGEVVLFGGSDPMGNSLADTWIFDGTSWSQVFPPASPPASYGQEAMASLGDSVVLFVADFDSDVTDTWVFDGTTWSHPTQTVPPVALFGFGSATLDGLVLLYGGYSGSVGTGQDRTFSWNGSTWQDLGPAAAPSSFASGSTPCLMATLP